MEKVRTAEWGGKRLAPQSEKRLALQSEKGHALQSEKRLALQSGEKKTYRKKAPVALVVSFLGKIHMLRVMVPASVPESSPSDGTFPLGK